MSASVSANDSSPCSDCGRLAAVTVEQGVKLGKEWVRWLLCVPCRLEEMRRGGEGAE